MSGTTREAHWRSPLHGVQARGVTGGALASVVVVELEDVVVASACPGCPPCCAARAPEPPGGVAPVHAARSAGVASSGKRHLRAADLRITRPQ